MEHEKIDFIPQSSLGSLQEPVDHVKAFGGNRSFRDAEKYVFFNPKLTRDPNLSFETALARDFYKTKGPKGEHLLRREAYEDLTRIESYLTSKAENSENQPVEDRLMLRWIDVQKAKLAFMQAAEARLPGRRGADFMNDEQQAEFARTWAKEVWGEADPEVARNLAATVLPERQINFPSQQAQNAVNTFLDTMHQAGITEKTEEVLPSKETLDYYRGLLQELAQPVIDHAFEGVEAEQFDEYAAKPIFEKAAEKLGLIKAGWVVEVDLTKDNVSVDGLRKTVYIGKRKNLFKRLDIERLILHEVFIHAQESLNGEEAGSIMLQTGMPGYLPYEEAKTTFVEFAWTGKVNNASHKRRYIIGAYAQGVFDGKFHSFSETYKVALGFALLNKARDGDLTDKDVDTLASRVYNETVRAYRGQDRDRVGVNDLALTSYYGKFTWLTQQLDPSHGGRHLSAKEFKELLMWKIDPTDPDQQKYIEGLERKMA